MSLRYLTSKVAQQIDEELMSTAGAFSLDQLMELAGLACAQALAAAFALPKYKRVLVCCGPGNQGGDGLVAARHLSMFGYTPTIYQPKPGSKDIYKRLKTQCDNMHIRSLESEPEFKSSLEKSDVIMDAIFGFSFSGPLRPPFNTVLPLIASCSLPVISVDIPSGWHVEKGPVPITSEDGTDLGKVLQPEVLISLTAPKEGVRKYKGRHFLGGRFIPPDLEKKFELNLPDYPGTDQIVELPRVE